MKDRLLVLFFSLVALAIPSEAQRITDSAYRTIGHIKSDGTIQDDSYRTIGHIKDDGTIQDASYRTVGHVKSNGTVQDASYRTVGHTYNIPREWAALFFFFDVDG